MNRIFLDNSIDKIIEKLKRKEILPSELVTASISNIREFNGKYFAWVMYGNEQVRKHERGEYIDIARLLENIPVGVKDIFNTVDFPTQMGSPIWEGFTPGNDARVVYNLKRQGAVVVGKTVTAEFAVHALNKTLNPYDIRKTPGTSSSGSAVAIALGMVPVALGTQTAGSIVRPASFCGIYGCKPSFGTIPRTGSLKTTDSLDTIGFFVVHRKDLQRVFDSLRVWGDNYPISNSLLGDPQRQSKEVGRPWKVAFARTHTWEKVPPYAKEKMEAFVKKLSVQKDIEVVDAPLPESMVQTHTVHETIYNKSLAYYFKGEYELEDFVSPVMQSLIKNGMEISTERYIKALEEQTKLIREMDCFFNNFDVIISLSTAGGAPFREITELSDPSLMWTITHLPVVSAPVFNSSEGMPFGLQIAARKYNDYLLFEFLDYIESLGLIPAKAGYFI